MNVRSPCRAASALVVLAGLVGSGCGGAREHALEHMTEIVPVATARDVWFNSSFRASATGITDPLCPVVTTMGTTTLYEGGCTDADGVAWSGSATVDGDPAGDFTITWEAFTQTTTVTCGAETMDAPSSVDGQASFSGSATSTLAFQVAFGVLATGYDPDCTVLTLDYSWDYGGTVEDGPDTDGDAMPDGAFFDGMGTVALIHDGERFEVDASTTDQFVDRDVCDQEPLSGTTTLTHDRFTAVLTNDGNTDCDEPPTGLFAFENDDETEVAIGGVCSIQRLGGGSPAALAVFAVAVALVLAIRRRRA